MAWRHTRLSLATLLVNGCPYNIGAGGEISPDPTDEDRVVFARIPELIDLDAPVDAKPKKTIKRRPTKRGKVAKK